jgi:hypothetical protein
MRNLLFILMLSVLTTNLTFSHERIEVVYLKNGSTIRGEIVEEKPNQYLKIETDNGSSVFCNIDEIDKITREKVENGTSSKQKQSSSEGYLTRGYRCFVFGEFIGGELIGGAITTTHGFQINKHIFVGGGSGIRFADDWSYGNHISIPLYANFRYDIWDNNSSPYLNLNSGICIPIQGAFGFYGALTIGSRFKRISIETGVEIARGVNDYYYYETDPYDPYYNYDYNNYYDKSYVYEKYNAFSFVARIGLEF